MADEHSASTKGPVDYLEEARAAFRVANAARYQDTQNAFSQKATAAALLFIAIQFQDMAENLRRTFEEDASDG